MIDEEPLKRIKIKQVKCMALRLVLFLNSFIISMVFLVSSGNFIILFLGWEMIGLTSFFLINF